MEQKRTGREKGAYINCRIDPAVKAKAEQLFDEMGLNMTTAVTVFLKRTIADGKLPFELMGYEEANNKRINDALMVAQREAADPNAIYHDGEEIMVKYRGKCGI